MAADTASLINPAVFLKANAFLLEALYGKSGAERWGVSQEDFTEALCRSAARHFTGTSSSDRQLEEYCTSLHIADLALVCALRKGSALAWEEFVKSYRSLLYAAARAIVSGAGEARARELADSLYADLYGLNRDGGKRPLLDYFHGRSKLATWLRAILAQRHIDALRASHSATSLDEGAASVRQAQVQSPYPERDRLLPRLRSAISAALAGVPATDRLLLGLYYVQGMKLAQIAQLQKVHEATISRQLDRIRRELRDQIERLLMAEHPARDKTAAQPGLSAAEVEQCFSYAVEDWGFDLNRALEETNTVQESK